MSTPSIATMSTDGLDVVVVGGGPAGIAAALAASRGGAKVALVDEYAAPGGQIWRRSFREVGDAEPASLPAVGRSVVGELARSGVQVLSGTSVWAARDARTLLFARQDGSTGELRARALVLATGAYDRPVAFPGWTLPGVITAGAAQALAKGQGVLPGKRILLAGAGPFLLPVATQLARSGATVVAVAEATRRRDWVGAAPRMLAYPQRLVEYVGYRGRMRSIPFRWGTVLVRAEGGERVERATLAKAARDWSPIPGSERSYEIDAVCTAYGFLPNVALARALGCELAGDAVAVDADMRTSVAGVFVAGEATGVGGSDLALIEGELAGARAAEAALGRPAGNLKSLQAKRARAAGFVGVLDDLFFGPRPGLATLAEPDTILCRCEDVTAGMVDEAGASSPSALKIMTRCGQGPCQGRICERLVAERLGTTAGYTSRTPLRPVPLPSLMEQ